jgi:hypothetical protein
LRDPRRDDHTICTAIAPDDVFTVRTYATTAPYEAPASAQIRTSKTTNQHVTALQNRQTRNSDKSQVSWTSAAVDQQFQCEAYGGSAREKSARRRLFDRADLQADLATQVFAAAPSSTARP